MEREVDKELESLDSRLNGLLDIQVENEMDLRKAELTVKIINAKTNILKAKTDQVKIRNEEKRIELDAMRLSLDQFMAKYNIASDLTRRGDKIQRTISKTMIGLFPEEDKQVLQIMKAAGQIAEFKECPH